MTDTSPETVVTGSPFDPLTELRRLPPPAWEVSGPFSDIRYEVAEGIARLTICRPERRNAFRPQTLFELTDAFTAARDNPSVGAIILTGEGPDAFCSGGDQKIRGDDGYLGDDEVAQQGIGRLNVLDLQILMRRIPKPIIAQVAGYAIGGGHILHLVCDLSIAADNARFGQTGPRVGSFDGGYGSSLLARTIGIKRAKEIWFLCRQYDAAQALEWGLVNTVVPLADLEAETVAWCRQIMTLSPIALRMIKAGFNAADDGLAGVQQLAGDATMLFYMTEEGQEGRNAFVEHRKPDFSKFPSETVSGVPGSGPGSGNEPGAPIGPGGWALGQQIGPVKKWWLGARPRTLPAAMVPVFVGTAGAWWILSTVISKYCGSTAHRLSGYCETLSHPFAVNWWRALGAMVVALAIQVGTNYANDYSDGVRGTDEVRVGPVRLVASGLSSPRTVKSASFVAFGVAGLAGLALAWATTWWLVPVGAACFLAGWLYTGGPRPYGYLGLGELFVFVFFGLVATLGSAFVQFPQIFPLHRSTIGTDWLLLWSAVAVGLLATALLEANNLRDIAGDVVAGKRTLAVRLGRRRAGWLYVGSLIGVGVGILLVALTRPGVLIALLALPLAIKPARLALGPAEGRELLPMLAATARLQLAVGVLLTVGILL